jgi:hypothetical protein
MICFPYCVFGLVPILVIFRARENVIMLGMVLKIYNFDFFNNPFIVRHFQILVAFKSGDGTLSNESKDGILSSESKDGILSNVFILSTSDGIKCISRY